jgi:hypothetical protein
LILVQAALERLSWELLVRHKEILSADGFSRLPAADQIRLLLAQCSIPLSVPAALEEIIAAARQFNWNDGPQALVETRNKVIHPPKKEGAGQKTKTVRPELPIYEACLLGQWYLELVLLRLFDFTGRYLNRTRKWQCTDDVPWL